MKIVCVIGSIGVGGGAERVMSYLCNFFSQRHECVYIALSEYKGDKYTLNDNVKLYNGLNYRNKIHAVKVLRKTILDEKPDIVLSFLTQINISVLLATRFTNIPVVISERGDLTVRNMIRKYLRLFLYPKAAGIVFQTKEARSHFKDKIYNNSIIIHNPVFINPSLLELSNEVKNKEIVSVGRFNIQKNHEMTIRAFANICKDYPDFTLKIYGGGELEQDLKDLISALNMQDKIFLCGRIPDVHNRILNASLFVMSSRWEGMPNALMEAMALGLPCISTNCPVGGPRELIEDGVNGFLINNFDQQALEDKIRYVLNNPQIGKEVGKNARLIMQTHGVSNICSKWEEYLMSKIVRNDKKNC